MRIVYLIQQLARSETSGVDIALNFPPDLGGGLSHLLRENRAGARLQLLSGDLELCNPRPKLVTGLLGALFQGELVQTDHRERRVIVIQPDAVTHCQFAHEPTFIE